MSQYLTQPGDPLLDTAAPPHRSAPRFHRGGLGAASALGMLSLVGAVCLAADPAASHAEERRTRALVATSAMAGAAALATGGDVVDAATDALARNGLATAGDRVRLVVNRPPLSGAFAGHPDAVEVVFLRIQAVGMAHVALQAGAHLPIRAVAAVVTVPEACPGAVDPSPCLSHEAAAPLRAPLLVE